MSDESAWERGFAALLRFKKREGHCFPSRFHVENGFNLGPWVSNQRYYKDQLSTKRRKQLDSIGFVWNWRDYLWEKGFDALIKFKNRTGHCRVPALHVEQNYRLGSWITVQRRNKNKNVMRADRAARLEKVGFIWSATNPPRIDRGLRRRAARTPRRNRRIAGARHGESGN